MSFKWYMGSLDPVNMLRVVKYNQEFRKQHPEYFDPEGIIVFCGMQGAGKTISAVQYVQKLCEKYPQVKDTVSHRLEKNLRYYGGSSDDILKERKIGNLEAELQAMESIKKKLNDEIAYMNFK